jgi:hypothetical protein
MRDETDIPEPPEHFDNVVVLNTGKRGKPKTTKDVLIEEVVKKIAFGEGNLPQFKERWIGMKDEMGTVKPLLVDENLVCHEIGDDHMVKVVSMYINELCAVYGNRYPFDIAVMKKIVNKVRVLLPINHEIAYFAEKSEHKLCYTKLDFDIDRTGTLEDCPTFAEFLSRTEQPASIAAWFGSVFFPDSSLSQYLWIYGDGANGKSSVGRIFERIFGKGFLYTSPPAHQDRFWTGNIVGKRLICFADCNKYQFVTSELFKNLTGGDSIKVEVKFHQPFNYKPHAKYLFFSNLTPNISSQKSDLRRAIFSEIKPVKGELMPDHVYTKLLWDEAPKFVGYCMNVYEGLCPYRQSIPLDAPDLVEGLAADNEIDLKNMFDEWFETDPNANLSASRLAMVMQAMGMRNFNDKRRFISYVARRCDERVRRREGYIYRGIREKTDHEKSVWAEENNKPMPRYYEGAGFQPKEYFPED